MRQRLSLFLSLGRITNLFFMPLNKTRLTYLWLLPLNFASLSPSFSLFFPPLLSFCFILFHLFTLLVNLVDSSSIFLSILRFLSLRIYVSYVSVFVHVHLRCYATVLVHGGTSIPFGTFLGHVEVILLYHADRGMNSNSFRVLVSLCSRCFEEEDRFSLPWRGREGRGRRSVGISRRERKENVSSIVLYFLASYNRFLYFLRLKNVLLFVRLFLWILIN